jgi:2-dehydropantoate 2-reductase
MRIVIMGTGGTGGYYGGLLARAGEDVAFIARGAHLEAMRSRGLTIKSKLAGDFTVAVNATDDPSKLGPVDLVLFCVKTYDTVTAAELIRPVVGELTVVLSVQNGIDQVQRITEVLGIQGVLPAAAYITAQVEAPGVISHIGGPASILLGENAGGQSPLTELIYRVFQRAGIAAQLHPDIRIALWEKFLYICGLSGVTALTRQPMGQILAHRETDTLLKAVMQEVAAVASACGIALSDDVVQRSYAILKALEPAARGSLAFDLLAHRRLEVAALNGTVVRLGGEQGVATPLNFAIYAALIPYIDGNPPAS